MDVYWVSKLLGAALFLARLKPLLERKALVFAPRNPRKTWEFMLEEGLDAGDAYDMIARLKPEHSYSGPEADRDGSPGNVMVFLYPYAKKMLYIKLKLWSDANGDAGAVISFHEEGEYD